MNGIRNTLPKRTNERTQGKRLAKVAKRLSFKACGICETKGSVYKAYEPQASGWRLWCYMCGAKDEACESTSLRGDKEYISMKLLRETIAMLELELQNRKGREEHKMNAESPESNNCSPASTKPIREQEAIKLLEDLVLKYG